MWPLFLPQPLAPTLPLPSPGLPPPCRCFKPPPGRAQVARRRGDHRRSIRRPPAAIGMQLISSLRCCSSRQTQAACSHQSRGLATANNPPCALAGEAVTRLLVGLSDERAPPPPWAGHQRSRIPASPPTHCAPCAAPSTVRRRDRTRRRRGGQHEGRGRPPAALAQ